MAILLIMTVFRMRATIDMLRKGAILFRKEVANDDSVWWLSFTSSVMKGRTVSRDKEIIK